MARFLSILCLSLLTMFGSAAVAASGARGVSIESTGIPSGFDELTREREQLVDIFFGGRKVGEARVVVSPGYLRFKDPDQVLTLIPHVEPSSELSQTFQAEFPTNAARVCPDDFTKNCGLLSPQVAGLIFDEDHFRVDLFVNRRWLRLVRPEEETYLPSPTAGLSLTSSTGLAVSGSTDSSPSYNFQNRTVVAFHNARIRTESAYASHVGFLMDTFVGEVDRPGVRYSAGLFWAPGLDLTGERRIVGVGFGTQFDTRTDRDTLHGTPLILFLSQPARVDIFIDGRLVTSGAYEAGNNMLDTSTLPDGSYSLLLRIHEQNGTEREERRFFAKNAQIAPVGQPIFFGYAGMLANTRPGTPVSVSNDMFYQLGAARRLSEKVALDVSLIGTSKRPIVEAGGWLILPAGRIRTAALVSAQGDRGVLLQIASAETGPVSVNFDLRRIWSHDNSPLIPISTFVGTFDSVSLNQNQLGNGSYTQASGSVGYQIGDAFVSVIGSLRKDEGLPIDYSVGPNLSWTLVNRSGMQIALQADAQLTRTTTAAYAGVRMLFNRGAYSVSSDAGARSLSGKGGSGNSSARSVGDTTAHFSYANDNGTDLSLAAGATRELESTTAHAEGMLYSRFGSIRGELLRNIEGSKQTQYGLSFQTGAILNGHDAVVGGRNLAESALVVSVDGGGDAEFDVLINGQSHGRVKPGHRLPIFLQPYHSYSVRLRPINAPSVWYDTAAHQFTLYPGNVQNLRWQVEHLLTVFGRAVRANGEPVADAMITSRRGMGQSNREGYFQIETSSTDSLSFNSGNGAHCTVKLAGLRQQSDFQRLGKVVCQ